MTTLFLVVAMHATALGAAGETYAAARRDLEETGKPMLIMVGTQWCGPCQKMKTLVLPQLRQRGVLGRVAFAQVDADRDGELARQLTGGGPVPQLVMYRQTPNGWVRRKLIGAQSIEAVEQFVAEGLAVHARETAEIEAAATAPPAATNARTPVRSVSMP